jgi:competence protein ComEA
MRTVLLAALPLLALIPAGAQGLPDGPNRELYENTCGGCHGADIVIGSNQSKESWSDTVDAMRSRGATGTEDDFQKIIAYLGKYFGPTVNMNTAPAKDIETNLEVTSDEAAAIVKYRTDNGNFKNWDDLTKVTGLDIKKIEPLKQRIVFTLPQPPAASGAPPASTPPPAN